jgi:hypothetical protein
MLLEKDYYAYNESNRKIVMTAYQMLQLAPRRQRIYYYEEE